MPALDLGTAASAGVAGVPSAEFLIGEMRGSTSGLAGGAGGGLVVDGGMRGTAGGAAIVAAVLGGVLALAGAADAGGGAGGLLIGDLHIAPISAASGGSTAAAASGLRNSAALTGQAGGRTLVGAPLFGSGSPGLIGASAGGTGLIFAVLSVRAAVAGVAGGTGGAHGDLSMPFAMVATSAGAAIVAAARLVSLVVMSGHVGADGYRRPQLVASAAGSSAAAGVVTIQGLPSLALLSAAAGAVELIARSAGSSATVPAPLQVLRAVAGTSAGVGAAIGAVSMRLALVGTSGGSAVVAGGHLVCWLALFGHSGAPGWERPQLAASAAGVSIAGGNLTLTGVANVALAA